MVAHMGLEVIVGKEVMTLFGTSVASAVGSCVGLFLLMQVNEWYDRRKARRRNAELELQYEREQQLAEDRRTAAVAKAKTKR